MGMFHIILGTFFFMAKPYKKSWMNSIDGSTITLIGVLLLINFNGLKARFLSGIVCGSLVFVTVVFVSIHKVCKACSKFKKKQIDYNLNLLLHFT